MKKLAVAVAAAALLGAVATAEQAARTSERAGARQRAKTGAFAFLCTTSNHTAARKPASVSPRPSRHPQPRRRSRSTRRINSSSSTAPAATASAARPAACRSPASTPRRSRSTRDDRREDDPQAARRHDAAAERAAARSPTLVTSFVDTLETRIDAAAALNPNPGWRPFQRLNRAEYQRAVRDLLGIDVDVTAFLPPDTISHGFDNVADVQNFSPTLMEGYLRAASQISRLAVGDRNASADVGHLQDRPHRVADAARRGRADGHARRHLGRPHLPGRRRVRHQDVDAQRAARRHLRPHLDGDDGHQEQVEVSIDGERVALLDLNPRMSETDPKNSLEIKTPPIHITAGPQRVSAAFIQRFDGAARRPARPAREHAGRRQHQLRRDRAAAHARHDHPRARRGHRRVGHRQPPDDLHLPADDRERRRDLRGRDRQAPGDAGVPRRGDAGRPPGRDAVLRAGPQEGRFRERHPDGAAGDSRQPALPVPPRAGAAAARRS